MEFTAQDLITESTLEEGTYELLLKSGKKIVIRKAVEFRTIARLRKRAAEILKLSDKGAIPPQWKEYLPITPQLADMMAEITGLVVDPKFTDLDVLKLSKANGMLAAWIHGNIRKNMEDSVAAAELEEIETEKND